MKTGKRILAFMCQTCPLCIPARKWPKSKFAKAVREMEKACPACKAYGELMEERKKEEETT